MKKFLFLILFITPFMAQSQYDRNLQRGERYMEDEDYSKAIDALRQARSDSSSYIVNHLLGNAYFNLQDFENAAEYYKRSLEFVDQDISDFRQLYLTYNFLEKPDKAQNILDLMVEYFPGVEQSKFYNWANQNLLAPCTPDFGVRESLRYCIKLDASGSIDNGNSTQRIYWRTDDNKVYNGTKITHCFSTSGRHFVKLYSEDNSLGYKRQSDTTITFVFLDNNSIVLEQVPDNSKNIEVTTYNIENNNEQYMYAWETGDGNVYFEPILYHKYTKNGEYNIKLTIFETVAEGVYEPICCIKKKCVVGK